MIMAYVALGLSVFFLIAGLIGSKLIGKTKADKKTSSASKFIADAIIHKNEGYNIEEVFNSVASNGFNFLSKRISEAEKSRENEI